MGKGGLVVKTHAQKRDIFIEISVVKFSSHTRGFTRMDVTVRWDK